MLAAKPALPAESAECKLHSALRETDRHCSRKLLLRKEAPSPETIGQLGRKRSIIVIEPPVTFSPSLSSFTPKLFAKVFTNERMRIEMPRIVEIFSR